MTGLPSSLALYSAMFSLLIGCGASPGGSRADGGGAGADGAPPSADGGLPQGIDAGPLPMRVDGGPVADAGCELTTPLEATVIGDPPDMLLVVDISGSMCLPLIDSFPPMPGAESKLRIMQRALDALVGSYEARINFGLMLFPSDNLCAPGNINNSIAPRNAAPIQSTLGGLTTDTFACTTTHRGATPTHTSLDAAADYYATLPVNEIGRYVLLATDGLPNCGPELPDGGTEETVDETVAAIEALFAADIRTYVLGFGADFGGGGTALNRMATAGGTGTPFNARTASELAAALDTIAAAIVPPSCNVEIGGPVRDPRLFQVRFDGGALIPRDETRMTGWDYDPATRTMTFYGASCAQLESGSVASVDVDFGCPGPLF